MKTMKIIIISAFTAAVALFGCKKDNNSGGSSNNGSNGADTVAKANLVLYMKFNNDATDTKGHSTAATNSKFTTDRFGTANKAWHNDSTNFITVTVPSTDALFVHSVTASLWVRAHHCTSTGFIVTFIDPNDPLGWDAGLGFFQDTDYKTDTLHMKGFTEHLNKDTHTFFDNYDNRATKTSWPLDKWIHVVYTYNASNSVAAMYLNGNLVLKDTTFDSPGVTAGSVTVPATASTLYIGKTPDTKQSWEHNFVGDIDDIRIYNAALSDAQVKNLYTAENSSEGQ
jgi:hypothetical protein